MTSMRLERYVPTSIQPVRSIEWVIAFFTFWGGTYVFTPLYAISIDHTGLSVLGQALAHPGTIFLWGAVLLIGSVLVMVGLYKQSPRIRSLGWFSIILARFFQLITIFVVAGYLPITWIYPLTLTAVCIILWGHARYEVHTNASS